MNDIYDVSVYEELVSEARLRGFEVDLGELYDFELSVPTPLGFILYRTCDFSILKYKPGDIVIYKYDGVSPFKHDHVKLYHDYLKDIWRPVSADFYVLMPCTRVKPYSKSVTHKMMKYYIMRLRERGVSVELCSVSEPMLLVPLRYEHLYPLANYDFPPYLMNIDEKKLMIDKLSELIPRLSEVTKEKIVAVLPRHHYSILSEASKKTSSNNLLLIKYGSCLLYTSPSPRDRG